ncbi:hypothetical protein B0H14DRAFT_3135934 [Mycena olivaceomarginata]|nr:hypothetical protein B0H14DRAFT_3135934 [Mycena olivaceomarginata]
MGGSSRVCELPTGAPIAPTEGIWEHRASSTGSIQGITERLLGASRYITWVVPSPLENMVGGSQDYYKGAPTTVRREVPYSLGNLECRSVVSLAEGGNAFHATVKAGIGVQGGWVKGAVSQAGGNTFYATVGGKGVGVDPEGRHKGRGRAKCIPWCREPGRHTRTGVERTALQQTDPAQAPKSQKNPALAGATCDNTGSIQPNRRMLPQKKEWVVPGRDIATGGSSHSLGAYPHHHQDGEPLRVVISNIHNYPKITCNWGLIHDDQSHKEVLRIWTLTQQLKLSGAKLKRKPEGACMCWETAQRAAGGCKCDNKTLYQKTTTEEFRDAALGCQVQNSTILIHRPLVTSMLDRHVTGLPTSSNKWGEHVAAGRLAQLGPNKWREAWRVLAAKIVGFDKCHRSQDCDRKRRNMISASRTMRLDPQRSSTYGDAGLKEEDFDPYRLEETQRPIPPQHFRLTTRGLSFRLMRWPAIFVSGQLVLQALGWGFFAVVKYHSQLALPFSTATWVDNNSHLVTLISTLVSTLLAGVSSVTRESRLEVIKSAGSLGTRSSRADDLLLHPAVIAHGVISGSRGGRRISGGVGCGGCGGGRSGNGLANLESFERLGDGGASDVGLLALQGECKLPGLELTREGGR